MSYMPSKCRVEEGSVETQSLRDSEDKRKDDHSVEELLAVAPTHLVRGGQDQNTVADPFPVANSKVERPSSRKDKSARQWENESHICPPINWATYYPTLPNNYVSLHF